MWRGMSIADKIRIRCKCWLDTLSCAPRWPGDAWCDQSRRVVRPEQLAWCHAPSGRRPAAAPPALFATNMGDATLSPKLLATATPAHAEPPATSDEVRMEAAALAVATLAGDTLDPSAWEEVLKHNPSNHLALSKLADIARMQGRHLEAAGYLERLLAVGMPPSDGAGASSEPAGLGGPRSQGEVHAALGHCFLAVSHEESDLSGILRRMQESHDAYKLALAQIVQGEDPDLWYGIGLLYDRYASLMKPSAQKSECEAAAIKAFDAVLTIEPRHERRDEVPPHPPPPPSLPLGPHLRLRPQLHPRPRRRPHPSPHPRPHQRQRPRPSPPGALQAGSPPQGSEQPHSGARVLHSHQREPLPPRRRSRRLVPGRSPPPPPPPPPPPRPLHLHLAARWHRASTACFLARNARRASS